MGDHDTRHKDILTTLLYTNRVTRAPKIPMSLRTGQSPLRRPWLPGPKYLGLFLTPSQRRKLEKEATQASRWAGINNSVRGVRVWCEKKTNRNDI
jgi:hypothetical protein